MKLVTLTPCWKPSLVDGDRRSREESGRNDGLMWYKDLGHHVNGELSMVVIQANALLEDMSHLESGPLSSSQSRCGAVFDTNMGMIFIFLSLTSLHLRILALLVLLPVLTYFVGLQEAYEEFKNVLLALIYGKDDQTSPVANEWMPCTSSSFACYCSNTQILVERLGPALQLNTNAYIICELVVLLWLRRFSSSSIQSRSGLAPVAKDIPWDLPEPSFKLRRLFESSPTHDPGTLLAIASMMRAQDVDPENLEVLLALGMSHTNELEQAVALKYLYGWLQNHPQVARLFNEAAQISPDDADVHIVLGVLYNLSREYDKVIGSFQTALKLKPRDYFLWNKLGATQANSVQSAETISSYQQSRGKSKPPGACWTCGNKGHFMRDCNSSLSRKIDDEEKNTMNLTEEVSSEEALLLSCDDVNESWIVDSGTFFHATTNVGFLTNIVKGDFDTVFLADKSTHNFTGKENARLLLPSGRTLVFQNV
ncbi:hypothetical protein GIB67_035773 [Kingdonia uniflora]|uniref:CCHC-type domain-containing protein n=1 Tax=Kingdonia uniflora TaxID=39325 RepID=A0A7J7MJH1_9MAGN|nr:hypothetical protein GIB67_035773 [Kingdonia uniflora]